MTIRELYPNNNPSLLLDFANVKALDPRITFTRASSATYYDGKTFTKAEENLLLRSQDYSATWTVTNLTPVTGKTAPDTTSTATEFTASAGNATLTQSITAVAGDYTFSVWLRRVTGTGNVDISANSGGTWVTQSITSTWTRFSVTQTLPAGTRTPGVRVVSSGDAIEVWGAQMELRSAVTAYTPTTTQPITNYIPALQTAASGVARFDHDPVTVESLGLLIEEQRTNLLTYSEDFGNAVWTNTRSSEITNIAVAPDGTLTATKFIEDTTASSSHAIFRAVAGYVSFTSGSVYTFSCFVKKAERDGCRLAFNSSAFTTNIYAHFNLNNGAITLKSNEITASATDVGNGWWRLAITATATITASAPVSIFILSDAGQTLVYTGNGYSGIYIWGAQLEAGEFPTSYIKTEGSQVTRSADAASMTGANFSSWYRQDEGTFYGNYIGVNNVSGGTRRLIEVGIVDSSLNRFVLGYASTATSRWLTVTNSVTQADVSVAATQGSSVKCAAAYKVNDIQQAANGTLGVADVNAVIPLVSAMQIGSDFSVSGSATLNGHIRKLAFYPKRLTDAQLQALTR